MLTESAHPSSRNRTTCLLSIGKTINKFGANTLTIADICTGSGVIGISMALDQYSIITIWWILMMKQ